MVTVDEHASSLQELVVRVAGCFNKKERDDTRIALLEALERRNGSTELDELIRRLSIDDSNKSELLSLMLAAAQWQEDEELFMAITRFVHRARGVVVAALFLHRNQKWQLLLREYGTELREAFRTCTAAWNQFVGAAQSRRPTRIRSQENRDRSEKFHDYFEFLLWLGDTALELHDRTFVEQHKDDLCSTCPEYYGSLPTPFDCITCRTILLPRHARLLRSLSAMTEK